MPRFLRWILALGLAGGLLVGAVVLLPFADWLPGGMVGDVPTQQVVNGTAFNRLFPAAALGEELVFSQEKRGFSEARLKRSGELVALLAISDTTTAPEARDKFAAAADTLAGWPLVEQGSQASAVLVGGRFQVKVIGQGVGLDAQARHELLAGFDLKALAAVRPRRIGSSTPAATLPSLAVVR